MADRPTSVSSRPRVGCAVGWITAAAVLGGLLWPVFRHRQSAKDPSCQSNLKQLSTALQMYAQDHNDRLPPAHSWNEATLTYTKKAQTLVDPDRARPASGYAFNLLLHTRSDMEITAPAEAPALFDSTQERPNAADRLQTFARVHGGGGNIAYADGHVGWVRSPPAADTGLEPGDRGPPKTSAQHLNADR